MGSDFELEGRCSVIHPIFGQAPPALSIDGRPVRIRLDPGRRKGEFFLEFDGVRERVFVASRGEFHFVHFRGRAHRVEAIDPLARARERADSERGEESLRAPMPGVVVRVAVEAGTEIAAGQLLMTIESMKLQTAIRAPHDGRVAEVCLGLGASFEQGATLVRLEAPTESPDAGQPKEEAR